MKILGIETSCDDTGIAIYDGKHSKLLGHTTHTQTSHIKYGGVVPEIASRDHISKISSLVNATLTEANLQLRDIDAIAYTVGPGLAGALLVGASFAKTLAFGLNKPIVAVNHIEGHLLAPMLEPNKPQLPYLALLVSGGHTALIHVKDIGVYELLGETLDDAAGEAFDKTAKLLGLGYPGGKALANCAKNGRPNKFSFPRPLINRPNLDFSFSGLKTHVLNTVHQLQANLTSKNDINDIRKNNSSSKNAANANLDFQNTVSAQSQSQSQKNLSKSNNKITLDPTTINDICCEFEQAITDTLVIKSKKALEKTGLQNIVVTGGVAANLVLRDKIKNLGTKLGVNTFFPRLEFCTDNGAMIAYAGFAKLNKDWDKFVDTSYSINAFPRLNLM